MDMERVFEIITAKNQFQMLYLEKKNSFNLYKEIKTKKTKKTNKKPKKKQKNNKQENKPK